MNMPMLMFEIVFFNSMFNLKSAEIFMQESHVSPTEVMMALKTHKNLQRTFLAMYVFLTLVMLSLPIVAEYYN